MIKKMLAMLAVVSCAFGAWAAHISGTDFALLDEGPFVTGKTDAGASAQSTYWYSGNTNDFDGTIIEGTITNVSHKILDFESNITNPVYRTILGCYGATAPSGFTPTNINSVLFVDTFVAFTPYLVNENHPAPTKLTNEDKILVWVRETDSGSEETANATNLIVTAGYLDVYGDPTPTNYVVNLTGSGQTVPDLCNGLHRLTIKAFKSITTVNDSTAGFVIYVDEYPVECVGDVFADGCAFAGNNLAATPKKYADLDQLFPSMMPWNNDTGTSQPNQLSAIGYAGVGQIGEVWYDDYKTDYPRFAGDNEQDFTVTFGADVASFIYKDVTYTSPTNLTAGSSETSVIISNVVYASGWKHADGMWRNGSAVVSNQVGTVGDYGTFNFADGSAFTLAGFKANYIVGDKEYQNLFGDDGALAAAFAAGALGSLKLNADIVIDEGDGYLNVDIGDTLVLDLNGHTIQGTSDAYATIVNNGGTLTIIDTSLSHAGKVLDSEASLCLSPYSGLTTLEAGEYEHINIFDMSSTDVLVINAGKYLDAYYDPEAPAFYLHDCVADGKVETPEKVGDDYYITVSDSGVTTYAVTFSTNTVEVAEYTTNIAAGATLPVDAIPAFTGGAWDLDPTNAVINAATNFNYTVAAPVITWDITFSTNNVIVTEWNLTVDDGDPIGNHIPNFTGGSWDAPAPTAETVVNSDTNFNYTIETSYTLTYVSDHGAVPDGVVYTASTPDFALAAAPDPGDVGVAFAGWVIGSVTNEAGATFVVADHLEDTTATAAWVALAPPKKFPQSDTAGTEYAGRDGTPALPFVIRNYDDLVLLKNAVADGEITTQSFEVVSNITGAAGWVGIGTSSSAAFAGTFNGNGKTITLSLASEEYNALFCFVNNATISNLTVNITGIATTATSFGGAAFVGKAYGSCTFAELKATGSLGTSVTPTKHNTAGICVRAHGDDGTYNFNNCTNEMAIYANYTKVGGILAFRDSHAKAQINFNHCVNTADINNAYPNKQADSGVAALIGWTGYADNGGYVAPYMLINGCENRGSISGTCYVGNFVGYKSVTPDVSGTNVGQASIKPVGHGTIAAFDWATVDGDLATFVTPVANVGETVTYKLMQSEGAAQGFTLTADDASLTIITNFYDYTGTVSVDASLTAQGYELVETPDVNGVTFTCAIPTPADPWEPDGGDHSDTAVSNKVIEVFGEAVAEKIHTYDTYTNMVAYLKGKGVTNPDDLKTGGTYETAAPYVYQSYMLGAAALFTDEPVISIVSVTPTATAGQWAFNVQVTQGESSTVLEVAAAKVAALVKVRTSLTTGSWEPPASVNADELIGGHTIQVTVSYGEAASGFMKISD